MGSSRRSAAVTAPADIEHLRRQLSEAQSGSEAAYRAVLGWVAARVRGGLVVEPEPKVRAALLLLHQLRHTYEPQRCPVRWVDGIIAVAETRARR